MHQAAQSRERDTGMSNGDFARMSRLIYDNCGKKMPDAKKTMLEARLGKRLKGLGMGSFAEYCEYPFSREGAWMPISVSQRGSTQSSAATW